MTGILGEGKFTREIIIGVKTVAQRGGPRGSSELHAHHIVPKSKGGVHEKSNLKTLCKQCHNSIHNNSQAPTATGNNSQSSTGNHGSHTTNTHSYPSYSELHGDKNKSLYRNDGRDNADPKHDENNSTKRNESNKQNTNNRNPDLGRLGRVITGALVMVLVFIIIGPFVGPILGSLIAIYILYKSLKYISPFVIFFCSLGFSRYTLEFAISNYVYEPVIYALPVLAFLSLFVPLWWCAYMLSEFITSDDSGPYSYPYSLYKWSAKLV